MASFYWKVLSWLATDQPAGADLAGEAAAPVSLLAGRPSVGIRLLRPCAASSAHLCPQTTRRGALVEGDNDMDTP